AGTKNPVSSGRAGDPRDVVRRGLPRPAVAVDRKLHRERPQRRRRRRESTSAGLPLDRTGGGESWLPRLLLHPWLDLDPCRPAGAAHQPVPPRWRISALIATA